MPVRTEYALIHGRAYSIDRDDYRELCVPCHKRYDISGERASNVKLTETAVRAIRAKYAESAARGVLTQLAQKYGVTLAAVSNVVHRKTWKHVV